MMSWPEAGAYGGCAPETEFGHLTRTGHLRHARRPGAARSAVDGWGQGGLKPLTSSLSVLSGLLPFPRRRRILVSGCRVNGRRSRSLATARRAAIDAVAASWTMGGEEDGCALYRCA